MVTPPEAQLSGPHRSQYQGLKSQLSLRIAPSKLLRSRVFSIQLRAVPGCLCTHVTHCTPIPASARDLAARRTWPQSSTRGDTAAGHSGPSSLASPCLGGEAPRSAGILQHTMIKTQQSPAISPVGEAQRTVLKIMNMFWTIILPGHRHS